MFCEVFADDIEFEIDGVADVEVLECGVVEGVGNDGYREGVVFGSDDGEADAVDADRAFIDEEVFRGGFVAEGVVPGAVGVAAVDAASGIVHVALYEVAIEAGVGEHGAFEVNEAAFVP